MPPNMSGDKYQVWENQHDKINANPPFPNFLVLTITYRLLKIDGGQRWQSNLSTRAHYLQVLNLIEMFLWHICETFHDPRKPYHCSFEIEAIWHTWKLMKDEWKNKDKEDDGTVHITNFICEPIRLRMSWTHFQSISF